MTRFRRSKRPRFHVSVSLFPFLAVLICTMGVLVVLLVIAVKAADQQAAEVQQEEQSRLNEIKDDLREQIETEEIRIEGLSRFKPDVQRRLRDERLRRSHLEAQIRDLQNEIDALRRMSQTAVEQRAAQDDVSGDRTRILQQLDREIAETEKDIRASQAAVSNDSALYSIVPTLSHNGTARRPIYVECVNAKLILQPLGIELQPDDFTIPVIPGNPLDAALLAVRQYWSTYQEDSPEGEPYPLLVVRPDGANSYAIARRAMQSWDDEFGYELVAKDIQLDFGLRDPKLAEVVLQAIEFARRKQSQIVAAHQEKLKRLGNDLSQNGMSGSDADPGSNSQATAYRSNSGARDALEALARFDNPNAGDASNDQAKIQSGSEVTQSAGNSESSKNRFEKSNATTGSSAGSGRANHAAASTAGQVEPMASQRGQDWALPTRTPGATPYRRPIRVLCTRSEILVYPGGLDKTPKRITVDGPTRDAVDALVDELWQQIESWGMAEVGGYWKPVLRISTLPDGVQRARDLQLLLEGSGLELEGVQR